MGRQCGVSGTLLPRSTPKGPLQTAAGGCGVLGCLSALSPAGHRRRGESKGHVPPPSGRSGRCIHSHPGVPRTCKDGVRQDLREGWRGRTGVPSQNRACFSLSVTVLMACGPLRGSGPSVGRGEAHPHLQFLEGCQGVSVLSEGPWTPRWFRELQRAQRFSGLSGPLRQKTGRLFL